MPPSILLPQPARRQGRLQNTCAEVALALESVSPVFRAVVTAVVPEAEKLDGTGWRDLERLVEGALEDRPPALAKRLRLFLRALQWLTLPRHGRRFTSLDPRRRAELLARLQDSRIATIRVGFWGLRTLALMGYYGRPEAARAIGYAPHPDGWEASA